MHLAESNGKHKCSALKKRRGLFVLCNKWSRSDLMWHRDATGDLSISSFAILISLLISLCGDCHACFFMVTRWLLHLLASVFQEGGRNWTSKQRIEKGCQISLSVIQIFLKRPIQQYPFISHLLNEWPEFDHLVTFKWI